MRISSGKVVLIDGNSLINRAFYALPPLITASGEYSNAVYGFINMLVKLIIDHCPEYLAVCFDLPAPTFRHKMYDGYKATRKGMPAELAAQLKPLKGLLQDMNISVIEKSGYEADDLLGTLSKRFSALQKEVIVVTGDRDCLQLIDDRITVFLTKRGLSDIAVMNRQTLFDEFGVSPAGIIELKALQGDSSDNIPGVPGVGEKTALQLIKEYQTAENVYRNIEGISGKLKEKLIAGQELCELSRRLAEIDVNVPLECDISSLGYSFPFSAAVREQFRRLEFKTLLKRNDLFFEEEVAAPELPAPELVPLKSLEELNAALSAGELFAFDLSDSELRFAFDEHKEYVITVKRDYFSDGQDPIALADIISSRFSPKTTCIVFDFKRHLTRSVGRFNALKNVFDVQLAQYLVGAKVSHENLDAFLGGMGGKGFSAAYLITAYKRLKQEISGDLESLFYNVESPLTRTLYNMEKIGFALDRDMIKQLRARYQKEAAELEQAVYALAGERFNINSPKQLGTILFGKLGLESGKKSKTGNLSTSVEVLETLDHEIVKLILKYRSVTKMLSTYIEGLDKQCRADGRVHTDFKQTVTVTGRLSSAEPNLQNIPVREEEGRILRKLFKAGEGFTLVSADYSQIELRLLAHFSGDPALLSVYESGGDVHTSTAALVNGVDVQDVTPEMRRAAKAVNFGIVYGISDYGLSKQLSVSVQEAKRYIRRYFDTYPYVKRYLDGLIEQARAEGKLCSLLGRVRYFPELKSSNYNLRSFGERAAMNMPLQSSAADLIKVAMLNVERALEGKKSRLILQVHDELIIETALSEREEVKELLKREMESAIKLSVPLTAQVGEGASLYDTK